MNKIFNSKKVLVGLRKELKITLSTSREPGTNVRGNKFHGP